MPRKGARAGVRPRQTSVGWTPTSSRRGWAT